MSIQDERDLRQRLSGLLNAIEPSPAPVARTARRGRGIRMRRWISVAAGLVLIAAGAVVIPGLIQQHPAVPSAPLHYKVTVTPLGSSARGGVVGEGTIDNKRWRVVLTRAMGDGCSPLPYLLTCGLAYGVSVGPREVSLNSASANGTQFELGIVGADVTRVTVQLSNGTKVDLTPVAAGGRRWVAFAAPLLTVREAVSFVGSSEYQYAIPYIGNAEFVTWLRPGQRGLARVTRQLGSGEVDGVAWHAAAEAGPWGYCVTFANGSTCLQAADWSQVLSAGELTDAMACGPAYTGAGKSTGASTGVVAVPLNVKDVVLKLSDGSRLRIAATVVDAIRVLGYAIPAHLKVVRVLEYGVAGQLLHSGSGAGWGC